MDASEEEAQTHLRSLKSTTSHLLSFKCINEYMWNCFINWNTMECTAHAVQFYPSVSQSPWNLHAQKEWLVWESRKLDEPKSTDGESGTNWIYWEYSITPWRRVESIPVRWPRTDQGFPSGPWQLLHFDLKKDGQKHHRSPQAAIRAQCANNWRSIIPQRSLTWGL